MRRPSLLFVVYVVIGLIVAASYDYFDNLKTTGRVLTLIAVVLMWPTARREGSALAGSAHSEPSRYLPRDTLAQMAVLPAVTARAWVLARADMR